MSYLQRTQRRELILTAATQLAFDEGLSAVTSRRIAQVAEMSTGQVHHHFESISHLKAEVFLALMQQLDALEHAAAPADPTTALLIALGALNIQHSQVYLALWNEAEVLMEQDPVLKVAYIQTMQAWQRNVVSIIDTGVASQHFKLANDQHSDAVAWRLIAFICGLEGMYQLQLFPNSIDDFKQQTLIMIQRELGTAQ